MRDDLEAKSGNTVGTGQSTCEDGKEGCKSLDPVMRSPPDEAPPNPFDSRCSSKCSGSYGLHDLRADSMNDQQRSLSKGVKERRDG